MNPASPKVLLVDDDAHVRAAFARALNRAGYRVVEAGDGVEALELLSREKPALVILDVEMPRLNGWKTLAEIRRRGNVPPVLMITHVNDVDARVQGLEAGADDYIGKPCEPSELLARVRALLRRVHPPTSSARTMHFGNLAVDLDRKTASRQGTPVHFTRTEYTLLDLFFEHAGKPVSRELMLERLWGARAGNSHTIDTHLWRLRKKLGDAEDKRGWIQNLPGIGFVLAPQSVALPPTER